MAKTFTGEITYSVTPDAAFSRHIDEDFLRRKFEAQGAREIEVAATRDGDRVSLTIDRKADADVPGFAKKVVKPTNTIHLVEEWRPEGDGYVCDWHAQISPAPARLEGTRTLLPSDGGTADVTEGTVEVKVPLIGGKLADWLSGEATKEVEGELAWIAQQDG
jgi:Protein of unknown function (DUF2505)